MLFKSSILYRITCLITLVALTTSVLRWEMAQVSVWIDMYQDFVQTEDVMTSLNKTLSGEAPCEGCYKIARERSAPSDEEASMSSSDPVMTLLLMALSQRHAIPDAPAPTKSLHRTATAGLSLFKDPPPVPPPRIG